ncbi:hypothetical protein K438DRAFT_1795327 [Mycena galopus ATCC 62051]|nr:hypothetical protein K438DRAFT_1795327 [Mycena galopus ATCC 62051]
MFILQFAPAVLPLPVRYVPVIGFPRKLALISASPPPSLIPSFFPSPQTPLTSTVHRPPSRSTAMATKTPSSSTKRKGFQLQRPNGALILWVPPSWTTMTSISRI